MIECVLILQVTIFQKLFPAAHRPTSKSKWSYYMYWVAFKITTLCSNLFEIGMPYTTYISGMDSSFNNKSRDLAEQFVERIQEFTLLSNIERESNA